MAEGTLDLVGLALLVLETTVAATILVAAALKIGGAIKIRLKAAIKGRYRYK